MPPNMVRSQVAGVIELLIDPLDVIDGNADFEDDGEDEPELLEVDSLPTSIDLRPARKIRNAKR